MGYKPTENYAAKDFLESGDPDKIVMGKEIQADFDAISRAFTDTDNKLNNLDYVDLRGDTMTGPLSTPEVIADNFIGGDVSANVVKATGFEGNGSGITGIAIDQLTDVSAPNPQRDQVLTYNGSAWESVTLDIVDSDLTFKGPADLTSPVPGAIAGGDMYVSESSGTIDSSWTGLGGSTTAAGDFVAYSDADARWFNLGSVAGGAVTSVGAGSGIVVDALQPTAPVVSVDRSETDSWYADKSTTEDGLRDVNSALATTTLRVDRNETDISGLREDLTLETEARADSDAELLALIQAARPGSQVTVGDDAPDNPIEGDLWYCTLDGSRGLFVWHESAWLATDPEAGPVLWKACPDGTFFDGGSVGVNTDTPYSRFHVDGENTPKGGITLSSGANHHTNYLASDFVNVHDIESSSTDAAHTWAIDGDEKARIDADGNLTVDGNFKSTGIDDNATSTAVTIDANENVGIANSSPSSVNAAASSLVVGDTDNNYGITIMAGSSMNGSLHFGDDFTIGTESYAGAVNYEHDVDAMNFLTASKKQVTIDAVGSVGIGTDITTEKLNVSTGTNTDVGPVSIALGGTATNTRRCLWTKDTTTRDMAFYAATGGSSSDTVFYRNGTDESMRVTSSGLVGIGTDAPLTALTVAADGLPEISIRRNRIGTNNGSIGALTFGAYTTGTTYGLGAIIQGLSKGNWSTANQGSELVFSTTELNSTTSAERLRINDEGNVGIGVAGANLDESLVVEGDIKIRGPNALWFTNTSGLAGLEATSSINLVLQSNASNGTLGFETNGSERLRIDAGGTTTVKGAFLAAQPGAGTNAFAAGLKAGLTSQQAGGVAVGYAAGETSQQAYSTALGHLAGRTTQGSGSVAIGYAAGNNTQAGTAVAIGREAGETTQGANGVAIGYQAGETSQGESAVGIGYGAGYDTQGNYGVAVGFAAGRNSQGVDSVAIGYGAGQTSQGTSSVAIGNRAGAVSQGANGIVISSRGTAVNEPGDNHIHITSGAGKYLFYNGTNSWEFAGGTVSGGGLRFDSIVQDGAPVVDSLQIIRAFMKLRDAVDDPDSSVEELREKLKVAVVDIIDQFQDQIDTMPVPEEPSTLPAPEEPELGTMPTPETPSTLPAPERPKRRD